MPSGSFSTPLKRISGWVISPLMRFDDLSVAMVFPFKVK
jgi:hypothetical protein